MSLSIVQQVDRQFPQLLQTNINATCYEFVVKVLAVLKSQGSSAYHICKTRGEGQYTPPGFEPHNIVGFDGKGYVCTGVSHDAIWCNGLQFDLIAQGNDSADPIFHPDGRPMVGIPAWNAIPKEYWRPNNPPLILGIPTSPPPVAPTKPYPGDAVWDAVGVALFADYARAGNAPDPQMGRWFGRTIWDATEGDDTGKVLTVEESIAKHKVEWRAELGLPQ